MTVKAPSRMNRVNLVNLLCLCALCLSFVGCYQPGDSELLQDEVKQFHIRFNDQEYEAIFEASTQEFKEAGPIEDLTFLLRSTRDRYGKVVRSKMTSFQAKEDREFTLLVAEFETTYERAIGWERFEFRIVGDKVLIHSYAVGSEAPTGGSDRLRKEPE